MIKSTITTCAAAAAAVGQLPAILLHSAQSLAQRRRKRDPIADTVVHW